MNLDQPIKNSLEKLTPLDLEKIHVDHESFTSALNAIGKSIFVQAIREIKINKILDEQGKWE